MKTVSGLKLSLVSGKYHEDGGSVVMEMASNDVKIRHVFASLVCLRNDRSTLSSNIIIAQWRDPV